MISEYILVGIDIGSTTTKLVVVEQGTGEIAYSEYRRHNAQQAASVKAALERVAQQFPASSIRLCLTGSGSKLLAEQMGLPFVQEVVANSIAFRRYFHHVGTAIELGGQDAKIIFFREEEETGQTVVSDMRMNGSCAGGTGAFIDEIASVLKTPVEEFDALAAQGTCVYDISGRCGVYAKTDIQPLLNQGVSKADLALSAFHAIAKQTIGGLAQGLDMETPVVFEGGPLTFNKTLIRVFAERLELSSEEILVPEHPEIMMAYGAALSLEGIFVDKTERYTFQEILRRLEKESAEINNGSEKEARPFFESEEEKKQFEKRHGIMASDGGNDCVESNSTFGDDRNNGDNSRNRVSRGEVIRAYLGIDSGSTTTKFVLMDEQEQILDSFYASNEGNPLMVAKSALIAMRERFRPSLAAAVRYL